MNYYRIPEMARKYIEYDMIQTHTELPQFPEYRTQLLYVFLSKQSNMPGCSELFSLVTSLVQVGLDTHDLVSVTNQDKGMKEARSRQLKILAGDYFSSRFYNLLAHAGHIDLIRSMSLSICEVNRLKINLYQLMKQVKLSADEYLNRTVDIRTQLYLAFTGYIEESLQGAWREILRMFTYCEVLQQEISKSQSSQQCKESWGYWHVMQQASKEERKYLQVDEPDPARVRSIWLKYKITLQLGQMLDACVRQLQDKLHSLHSNELSKELFAIGEPFIHYLSTPKVLEEI